MVASPREYFHWKFIQNCFYFDKRKETKKKTIYLVMFIILFYLCYLIIKSLHFQLIYSFPLYLSFVVLVLCFFLLSVDSVLLRSHSKTWEATEKNVINRSENSVSIAHSHSHSQFKYWVINIFSKIVFV